MDCPNCTDLKQKLAAAEATIRDRELAYSIVIRERNEAESHAAGAEPEIAALKRELEKQEELRRKWFDNFLAVKRERDAAWEAALTCVCGHLWMLHDGHTYSPPSPPPSFCSQADGCRIFTPTEDVLRAVLALREPTDTAEGGK